MEKQFRLPKPFAIKWLEALRSGKYDQTTCMMAKFDKGVPLALISVKPVHEVASYCCLGVAGLIQGMSPWMLKDYGVFADIEDTELDARQIPHELRQELLSYFDDISKHIFVKVLTQMNDDRKSFAQIADYIEANTEFYVVD